MDLTIRLAEQIPAFALPSKGPAQWAQTSGGWETRISLPSVPQDHIIIPSFASTDFSAEYQFALAPDDNHADRECRLYPVPSSAASQSDDAANRSTANGVTAHIDCWHSTHDLTTPTISLRIKSATKPQAYQLSISIRPLQLKSVPLADCDVQLAAPSPISQMQADAKIRKSICSPTALAMALGHTSQSQWFDAVDACFDPATRTYGAWPLAIRYAAKKGFWGSVEGASNWDNALSSLHAGTPVVCSIRFTKGELTNAPLTATGGHLVCLYGIRHGKALVMDPAGADTSSVAREYDLEQFARAWLTHRGAGYYFGSHCK